MKVIVNSSNVSDRVIECGDWINVQVLNNCGMPMYCLRIRLDDLDLSMVGKDTEYELFRHNIPNELKSE